MICCNIVESSEIDAIFHQSLLSDSMFPTIPKDTVVEVRIPNHVTADKYCRGCIVAYTRESSSGDTQLYIHRIIALAGEKIEYSFDSSGGGFSVENMKITISTDGQYTYLGSSGFLTVNKDLEKVGNHIYGVLREQNSNLAALAGNSFAPTDSKAFPILIKGKCTVRLTNFECEVPENYVFVAGDNRAHTLIGFVPVDNIVGYVSTK